jgi:hypothetical protein
VELFGIGGGLVGVAVVVGALALADELEAHPSEAS